MLSDLAFALSSDYRVSVVTPRQLVGGPDANLCAHETVDGIAVHRVWTTTFDRARLASRAFYYNAAREVRQLARPDDVAVAKTDSPVLSAGLSRAIRKTAAHQVNWLQDLFPEVASALGAVSSTGALTRRQTTWRNLSLRTSAMNVVLYDKLTTQKMRLTVCGPDEGMALL
ncbi:MAG: hypothetical protein HOI95_10125 [Chromatiales bacterium]|jgi:colanic acid biosynthesis glycosyl transferase WcaI|nr:hypothetical protein [Chromatiales bacterium]